MISAYRLVGSNSDSVRHPPRNVRSGSCVSAAVHAIWEDCWKTSGELSRPADAKPFTASAKRPTADSFAEMNLRASPMAAWAAPMCSSLSLMA